MIQDDVFKFSEVLQKSIKLHSFTLQALPAWPFPPHHPSQEHLLPASVQPVLSIETLTTLVLDLPETALYQEVPDSQNIHLCPIIGKLLGTLRVLHLRLPFVCQAALTPPDPIQRLDLESIILNLKITLLSLSGGTSVRPSVDGGNYARDCEPSWQTLPEKMKQSLIVLQTMMKSPKISRLVEDSAQPSRFVVNNLLSGESFEIAESAPWDGDESSMNRQLGNGPGAAVSTANLDQQNYL